MLCSPLICWGELKLNVGASQCRVVLWDAIATGELNGTDQGLIRQGKDGNVSV